MPKVSVIIPVYNSELFLEEAVQSVLDQTLSDFEVILVNDRSTDNSGSICDDLARKDTRVRVNHLEVNKGICGARNAGLRMAQGEYVAFCDNDDYFTNDLLEDNYTLAKEYDSDMVKFGRRLIDVDAKGNILREKDSPIPTLAYYEDQESLLDNFFSIKSTGVLTNVWNGLYKLSTILENDIWFDEEMRFGSEDADFSFKFFTATNSLVVNPKAYYIHYRRDAFSTSRKFSLNKIKSMIKAAKTEAKIWSNLEDTEENKVELVMAKNNHVINAYKNQVLHDDSGLSYKEKIEILEWMLNQEHLNYSLDKNISRIIRNKKPKQWLFTQAYHKKKLPILHTLLFLEDKVKGEKW